MAILNWWHGNEGRNTHRHQFDGRGPQDSPQAAKAIRAGTRQVDGDWHNPRRYQEGAATMSELFIVEVNDGISWSQTYWTGWTRPMVSPRPGPMAVERPEAEEALATAQRCYPDSVFRIVPAPKKEGA